MCGAAFDALGLGPLGAAIFGGILGAAFGALGLGPLGAATFGGFGAATFGVALAFARALASALRSSRNLKLLAC